MTAPRSRSAVTAAERRDVALRLHAAALRLLRALRRENAASGQGPARLSALSVLVFGGAQTLGALAAIEGVRPPTMSRMVEGLVAAGLVRRAAVPEDRRAVLLRATPAGRRLMLEGRERRVARLSEFLIEVSANELRALSRAADLLTGLVERGLPTGRR